MATDQPVNSEIHPLLEFIAPKSFYVGKQSTYIYLFDEKFDTLSNGLFVKEYVKKYPPDKNNIVNTINYNLNKNVNSRFAFGLSKYLLEKYPVDYTTNLLFSKSYKKLGLASSGATTLEKLISLFPDSVQVIKDYNNESVLEKTNATTFMKLFSLRKEADAFIRTTKPDSIPWLVSIFSLLKDFYKTVNTVLPKRCAHALKESSGRTRN
jgi:hypothetical protein